MKFFGLFITFCLFGPVCQGQSGMLNGIGFLSGRESFFNRSEQYVWSSAFYRPYGLHRNYDEVYLNKFRLANFSSNGVDWNQISGMNELLRNRTVQDWYSFDFPIVSRVTQFEITPMSLRNQSSLVSSLSSGLYSTRLMLSHNNSGWFNSLGIRYGDKLGSPYRSLSLSSVKNCGNSTIGILAVHTKRNMSSALTEELMSIKGSNYNPNWGFLNGSQKYSRIRNQSNITLFVEWDKAPLSFGWMTSFRLKKQSFLDSRNFPNARADYYKRLPSYADYKNDFERYYELEKLWNEDSTFSQVDYDWIYEVNKGKEDAFYLSKATVEKDYSTQLYFQFTSETGYWNLRFHYNQMNRYRQIDDLFGANSYLNRDNFEGVELDMDSAGEFKDFGDRIDYSFIMKPLEISLTYHKTLESNRFLGKLNAFASYRLINRFGEFQHESYSEEFKRSSFTNIEYSLSIGGVLKSLNPYKLGFYSSLDSRGPKSIFENVKFSGEIIPNLKDRFLLKSGIRLERVIGRLKSSLDLNFVYQDYGSEKKEFYTDDFFGYEFQFIEQYIEDLYSFYYDFTLSLDWEMSDLFNLYGAFIKGQHRYRSNPLVRFSTSPERFETLLLNGKPVSSGPKTIYAFAVNYRSSDYFWFELAYHHLGDRVIDYNYLNLHLNPNHKIQDLGDVGLLNLVFGKSLKTESFFISIFLSIQNILDQYYAKGGYESSRIDSNFTSYPQQNRYWYDFGRSYFLNLKLSI